MITKRDFYTNKKSLIFLLILLTLSILITYYQCCLGRGGGNIIEGSKTLDSAGDFFLNDILEKDAYSLIYAHNSVQYGIDKLKDENGPLKELLEEKEGALILFDSYMSHQMEIPKGGLIDQGDYILRTSVLELFLAQKEVISNLTKDQKLGLVGKVIVNNQLKTKYQEVYGIDISGTVLFGRLLVDAGNKITPEAQISLDEINMSKLMQDGYDLIWNFKHLSYVKMW